MNLIEVKRLNGNENELPEQATIGSAGLDIRANIDQPVVIKAGETVLIGSGLAINIDNNQIAAVLIPRSGLGVNDGIVLGNLVGLIDSDYQGEVKVALWNRSNKDYAVDVGQRICQMVFVPVVNVKMIEVSEFKAKTSRGDNGFGSTGVQ